jgi:hypothetical protein
MPEYEDDDADMAEQLVFTRYIDRAFMARKEDVRCRDEGSWMRRCTYAGVRSVILVCPPHKKFYIPHPFFTSGEDS